MRGYLVTITTLEPYPVTRELTYKCSGPHIAASRAVQFARKNSAHVRRITHYSISIKPL